jgi:GT2 family glycosyltransferase
MKISIITATYNSATHISGCLESVNNQVSHTMTLSHGMTTKDKLKQTQQNEFRKNQNIPLRQ